MDPTASCPHSKDERPCDQCLQALFLSLKGRHRHGPASYHPRTEYQDAYRAYPAETILRVYREGHESMMKNKKRYWMPCQENTRDLLPATPRSTSLRTRSLKTWPQHIHQPQTTYYPLHTYHTPQSTYPIHTTHDTPQTEHLHRPRAQPNPPQRSCPRHTHNKPHKDQKHPREEESWSVSGASPPPRSQPHLATPCPIHTLPRYHWCSDNACHPNKGTLAYRKTGK